MMPDEPFRRIAEKLANLSRELKSCTDPVKRLGLLKKFRAVLADADKIIAQESAESC
jgi:hypothetical protein